MLSNETAPTNQTKEDHIGDRQAVQKPPAKPRTERLPAVEPYYSVNKAARALGIKYHTLLAAVANGTIPSYRPFNSRRLVRISEIEEVIRRFRVGGPGRSQH